MSFDLDWPTPPSRKPRECEPPLQEKSWEAPLLLIGIAGLLLFMIIHWK